jgi:hypothetical protein
LASIIVAQIIIGCVTAAALWLISRRPRPNPPWRIWRVVALVVFVATNVRAHEIAINAPWLGLAGPLFILLSGAVVCVLVWTFGLRPSRPF